MAIRTGKEEELHDLGLVTVVVDVKWAAGLSASRPATGICTKLQPSMGFTEDIHRKEKSSNERQQCCDRYFTGVRGQISICVACLENQKYLVLCYRHAVPKKVVSDCMHLDGTWLNWSKWETFQLWAPFTWGQKTFFLFTTCTKIWTSNRVVRWWFFIPTNAVK